MPALLKGNKLRFVLLLALPVLISLRSMLPSVNVGSFNSTLRSFSPNDPVVWDTRGEEWTRKFRDNWKLIRDEYLAYSRNSTAPLFSDITVFAWPDYYNRWRSVLLQLTGRLTSISDRFPRTVELLRDSPSTTAMFSVLEPGAILTPHSGPYQGSRRYHLGLIVPEGRCELILNGKQYKWREGGDMLFDDNYEHAVINDTPGSRVVLFVDTPRVYENPFVDTINRILLSFAYVDPEISAMFERAQLVQ